LASPAAYPPTRNPLIDRETAFGIAMVRNTCGHAPALHQSQMLLGGPVGPACHPVRVNMAGVARGAYIGVGEEVGVHIDELLVGFGDVHDHPL
jgi:hypothetical protein